MVYILEVSSPDTPNFRRIIHIDANHTFEDLHQIIQNSCDLDQSQLASFYVNDGKGKNLKEIGALDSAEATPKTPSIQKTKLKDYINNEIGQKLIYVYDFFNELYFYIELKEKIMKTDLKEPFVAYENGKAPAEVDLLDADESYQSFGDLEDYYEIYGEMDA